jgi:SWI/SNF-related matrix-associated actin-dependent regulator 1 of chromatin subfamily A
MPTLAEILGGAAPTTAPATPVTIGIAPLALPLLDHQIEGVRYALDRKAAYLAHDMGTGKTATAIGWAASLVAAGEGPVLIVVPPSLRTNWAFREIPRFAPNLKVELLTGTKPHPIGNADVYVIGDSSVKGWADLITGTVVDGKDRRGAPIYRRTGDPLVRAIVVDEAHRAKNKSQRTAAIGRIASVCGPYRLLLSGTPAPKGEHQELATQINILGDDAWAAIGGKGRFWGYYCPPKDRFGGRGNHDTAGLHSAMSGSWFQRLLKGDVLDLPNKGRSAVAVTASGRAARAYIAAEEDLIQWLANEGRDTRGAERAEALVRLTTLRQLAGEAKVKAAVEHVTEILEEEDGGVFVVAEHKNVLDLLVLGLSRYNPVEVRGGMSDSAKQEAVDAFNDGTSRVLVGQVVAAGVGLTLHGAASWYETDAADRPVDASGNVLPLDGDGQYDLTNAVWHHRPATNKRVVVVQLPWTPADLQQAEDRLHRIGQTNEVVVEILLSHMDGRWSIDERLWSSLESKYFNSKELVDGNGEFMISDIQEGILDSYR